MSQPENVIPMSQDLPIPPAGANAPTKGEGKARKRKADKPFDFGRLNTLMADMVLMVTTGSLNTLLMLSLVKTKARD